MEEWAAGALPGPILGGFGARYAGVANAMRSHARILRRADQRPGAMTFKLLPGAPFSSENWTFAE